MIGGIAVFLAIFRARVGAWKLWSFISYASFFVYLYHRPIWDIVLKLFPQETWRGEMLFRLIPGSLASVLICYALQLFYDRIIELVRKRYS
jgi:peptidoglycan/LPS O-acetylase OafA/YrhL